MNVKYLKLFASDKYLIYLFNEKEMISKKRYFSSYESPNIVIVPISSEQIPTIKRAKVNKENTENAQICQNRMNTLIGTNVTQNSSVHNMDKKKPGSKKNVPRTDTDHSLSKKMEKSPKEESGYSLKIENKINVISKIEFSDSLNTTNHTKARSPKKYNEINKHSKQSSPKEHEDTKILKCSKNIKVLNNDVQIGNIDKKKNYNLKSKTTIDANIYNTKIDNSNMSKSTSKKPYLCRITEAKVAKHDKKKAKTPKIIKIVINITCNNLTKQKDAKAMSEPEYDRNPDISFLDDFDVDEVVDSLLACNNTDENMLNMKENINQTIQVKGDLDNALKKSTHSTEVRIRNMDTNIFNFTKTAKKATENNSKDIEQVPHISGDINVNKLRKGSQEIDRSLEKVINKIKANEQKNYKEVLKILQPTINNVTGTILKSKEPELLNIKPVKNHLMVCNNTKHSKEDSKNFCSSDSNNDDDQVTVKEVENVMDAVNIQEKIVNNECSLKIKHEYWTHCDELLSRKIEIKVCDLLMMKFSIDNVTHHGKFSKIFKCTNNVTGITYAMKILNKWHSFAKGQKIKKMLQNIQKEIPKENLSCIFLINSFTMEHHWCFMTPYFTMNLQQVLHNKRKSFHVDQIHNLFMQLVQALIILRTHNIVHCDIRPSHLLLNNEITELKLCGFDEAYYCFYYEYVPPTVGTVNYRAPEIILGHSHGFSIDIWSAALVMYEMATSCMLFSGETNNEILYQQMSMFGNFPYSVIMHSRYKQAHFVGTNFVRNGYCDKVKDSINHFGSDGDIKKIIIDAYKKQWGKIDTENDMVKLNLLCCLLKKMFILDPKYRLPIEYVYANPFFSTK